MISLCMIVKDESSCIERCLASVKELADEIIIVDTGSKDLTRELCKKYGADVYEFPWIDDFSAARNYGIKKAQGDWILWLDADEELKISNHTALMEYLKQTDYNVVKLDMVHYYGSAPVSDSRCHFSTAHRLFRNGIGIQFYRKIHETLNLSNRNERLPAESAPGIKILHYGYLDQIVRAKHKNDRNLQLLYKEQETHPDPWNLYHIASEFYRRKDYKEAFELLNQAIMAFLEQKSLPPALIYKLKYDLLLQTGCLETAAQGLQLSLHLYPDYVDLWFYQAVILIHQTNYQAAITSLSRCLELGDRHPSYLTIAGAGSSYALYYMGICHEQIGDFTKAIEAYQQAFDLNPDLIEARTRIDALTVKLKKEI